MESRSQDQSGSLFASLSSHHFGSALPPTSFSQTRWNPKEVSSGALGCGWLRAGQRRGLCLFGPREVESQLCFCIGLKTLRCFTRLPFLPSFHHELSFLAPQRHVTGSTEKGTNLGHGTGWSSALSPICWVAFSNFLLSPRPSVFILGEDWMRPSERFLPALIDHNPVFCRSKLDGACNSISEPCSDSSNGSD